MTPLEDDPGIWAALMRLLRPIGDSMAYVMPFLAPAFLGALLGAWRGDRRNKGRWHWLSLVAWSMAAGAGFAPLFMHLFGLPESVAGSAACALAFFGKDGTDMIRRVLASKADDSGENGGA